MANYQDYYAYLVSKGVPAAHAQGWVANMPRESSGNPAAIGDGGNSVGLNQWSGPRRRALQNFALKQGKDWRDPYVQLDYGLTEGDTKKYLAQDYGSGEQAAEGFLRTWERPAKPDKDWTKTRKDYHKLFGSGQSPDIQFASGLPPRRVAQPQGQPQGGAPQMAQQQQPNPMMLAQLQSLLGSGGQEEAFGGMLGQAGRALMSASRPYIYGQGQMPNYGDEMRKESILAEQKKKNKFERELRISSLMAKLTGGSKAPEPTAIERQLAAAGYTPGSSEYQQALNRYIFKPSGTTVNVGGEQAMPPAPEGGQWTDIKKGMYMVNGPQGPEVKYVPGSTVTQPTAEERKMSGQLEVESELIDDIDTFASSSKGEKLYDLAGKASEYARSSDFGAATLRSLIPEKALELAGLDPNDPDIAKAMGSIAQLRSVMLNRISGAAVSDTEAERMLDQLPTPGQPKEVYKANVERTKNNLQLLRDRQARNEGRTPAPKPASMPQPAAAVEPVQTIEDDAAFEQFMQDNF